MEGVDKISDGGNSKDVKQFEHPHLEMVYNREGYKGNTGLKKLEGDLGGSEVFIIGKSERSPKLYGARPRIKKIKKRTDCRGDGGRHRK